MANDALLAALCEGFDEENALLGQVLILVEEVSEVVLNLRLLVGMSVTASLDELDLLLGLDLDIFVAVDVLGRAAQVLVVLLRLVVRLLAVDVLSALMHFLFCRSDLDVVPICQQLRRLGVVLRFVVSLLIEVLALILLVSVLAVGCFRTLVVAATAPSTATTPLTLIVSATFSSFILRIDSDW